MNIVEPSLPVTLMIIAFGILLVLHGFAHLVGFLTPWGLIRDAVPATALFNGKVPVSLTGMRTLGILWLAAAALFAIAAVAVFRRDPWWHTATIFAIALSMALSVASTPQARIGVLVNAALIAILVLNKSFGWLQT